MVGAGGFFRWLVGGDPGRRGDCHLCPDPMLPGNREEYLFAGLGCDHRALFPNPPPIPRNRAC